MKKSTIKRTVAVSLYALCMLSSAFCIENIAETHFTTGAEKRCAVIETIVGGTIATGSLLGVGHLYTSKKDDEINNLDLQNEKIL